MVLFIELSDNYAKYKCSDISKSKSLYKSRLSVLFGKSLLIVTVNFRQSYGKSWWRLGNRGISESDDLANTIFIGDFVYLYTAKNKCELRAVRHVGQKSYTICQLYLRSLMVVSKIAEYIYMFFNAIAFYFPCANDIRTRIFVEASRFEMCINSKIIKVSRRNRLINNTKNSVGTTRICSPDYFNNCVFSTQR